MPSVVSRWQGGPAQKFCRARKIALAAACGAFAPSSCAVIVPHVVTSVSFHCLPSARDFGGAALKLAGGARGGARGGGGGGGAGRPRAPPRGRGRGWTPTTRNLTARRWARPPARRRATDCSTGG